MFGLDHLAKQKLIFFQEISDQDREIANNFGYDIIGSDINIGIAEAYSFLVEKASEPIFLFLENDWLLLEKADKPINAGIQFLNNKQADVIRYRHKTYPGHPLWTRQFDGKEYDRPTHLLDSIHWREDPSIFPEITKKVTKSGNWYFTDARYANWTNNPTMFKTEFLVTKIVPRLGDGDIERDLQGWWEKQTFIVAQGDGLFTHFRID